jgi:hypothetical protein
MACARESHIEANRMIAAAALVCVAFVYWAATYDADPLRDWTDTGVEL